MTVPSPFAAHADGTVVDVWVVPGASRSVIAGNHDGALRVRVAAPPQRGKANRAVLDLLRDATGVRRARLIRGGTLRRKAVLLEGIAPMEAERLLGK